MSKNQVDQSRQEVIGVVGLGTMGRGIARVFAVAGYRVLVSDVDQPMLERGLQEIAEGMDRAVRRGDLDAEARQIGLARITATTSLEELAHCDLIIEAIPEDIDLKKAAFESLDAAAKPEAILATNTSALSITEIGAATSRPDRVVGLHFFNPPHRMKLVEVVIGAATSEHAAAEAERVCREAGKETVRVKDSPGFATSRISALIGNEALYMLMDGVATAEDLDKAVRLGLHHPMGPLELGDLVGLDTRLHVLEHLHRTLGERFRPCPLLVEYVQAGRLGRKAGIGVYQYDGDGNRLPGPTKE
ncbi:MAG: 3-hydroxyacyl-CoA dehydrogenase family protein [Acidimicrobiia bacterium]